jgi:glycerol-3-phosphate acyltransferase PlsY
MYTGIIAVVIAYFLGSVPSAYIVTRLLTGKDIRRLGGGNSGAHNVFLNVGRGAGILVGVLDVVKGAAAVVIAFWVLDAPDMFVLAAGLAVVVGHIWSVFLKFTGGNGLAATIGVLLVLMTKEVLVALAVALVLVVITRNVILSTNISLLIIVPLSALLMHRPWLFVVFPLVISVELIIHFLPTARAALAKAGSKGKLGAELIRRDGGK